MEGFSDVEIAQQEAKLLKSKERASLLCSLLSAYRLLDVVALLEADSASILPVPVHHKIAMDFTKHAVSFFWKRSIFFYVVYSDSLFPSKIGNPHSQNSAMIFWLGMLPRLLFSPAQTSQRFSYMRFSSSILVLLPIGPFSIFN